jgi:uncharacterized membrane protein
LELNMVSVLAAISATVTLGLAGVMAGIFFAFSNSVMPGLDAVKAEEAIHSMQSINRKIQNALFLVAFAGVQVAAAVTGALLLVLDQTETALWFFLAAAAYLLGAFALTMVLNVPMNNALDAATVPTDPKEAATLWSDYSVRWTRWNTVRAVFSTISVLLVGLALFVWGRQW